MKMKLIMLAAGNSRRFQGNKLLYCIEDRPMYQRILNVLLEVKARRKNDQITICVVTQYEEIMDYARQKGVTAVENPHPERGISSSLRLGLQTGEMGDAALFVVSDQPWLQADTVCALMDVFQSEKKGMACVADGNGTLGNPCVFSSAYYEELLQLTGDTGGKGVIQRHLEDTAVLRLERPGRELLDVDVKDDIGDVSEFKVKSQ